MKKLTIAFLCILAISVQAQVDSSLYQIGALGRLIKIDTASTNIIVQKRVGNMVKSTLNINGIFHGVSTDTDFVARQKQVIPNYLSSVIAGTSTPSVVNGVMYNIINDYTGESVNYKPITTFANGNALVDSNADGVLIIKVGTKFFRLAKDRLNAKDFGAKGDGATDDYVAIQKAMNVCAAWGLDLTVTPGNYNFSHFLNYPFTWVGGNSSFFNLNLIGTNARDCILQYTGTGMHAIEVLQGSGSISKGGPSNLTFVGNGTGILVYVDGRCGFTMTNCYFQNAISARQLNNSQPGTFNEFCVNYNCTYETTCRTILDYKVGDSLSVYTNGYMYTTGGALIDQSFHGSGEVDATVNSEDSSCIKIGRGALPYHSPLSLQDWVRVPGHAVVDNQSLLKPSFMKGSLTTESFTNPTVHSDFTFLGKGNFFSFQGSIGGDGSYDNGTLYKTDHYEFTQPSQGNGRYYGTEGESYQTTVSGGYDTIRNIGLGSPTTIRYVSMHLSADQYFDNEVLTIQSSGNSAIPPTLTIESYGLQFRNGTTLKTPVYTMGMDGSLMIELRNNDGTLNTQAVNIYANIMSNSDYKNNIPQQ